MGNQINSPRAINEPSLTFPARDERTREDSARPVLLTGVPVLLTGVPVLLTGIPVEADELPPRDRQYQQTESFSSSKINLEKNEKSHQIYCHCFLIWI